MCLVTSFRIRFCDVAGISAQTKGGLCTPLATTSVLPGGVNFSEGAGWIGVYSGSGSGVGGIGWQ